MAQPTSGAPEGVPVYPPLLEDDRTMRLMCAWVAAVVLATALLAAAPVSAFDPTSTILAAPVGPMCVRSPTRTPR